MARDEDEDEIQAIFPDRDDKGRWRHPKDGRVLSDAQAKRVIRNAERKLIVKNAARATGKTEKQVRAALKGVKTTDIVGAFAGRKKDGTQRRGEWVQGPKDRRKTLLVPDRRKGREGKKRRVPNPDYGKRKRVFRSGPTKKGKRALRKLGLLNADGLLDY